MKNLFLIILVSIASNLSAQRDYHFCFDAPVKCGLHQDNHNHYLYRDTNSNATNIWQIGAPQKSILSNAQSSPNVIITQTSNTYPVNDTSSFIIQGDTTSSPSKSVMWSNFEFSFDYFVDSDTLVDFGKIEFSPDSGTTWIDLINDPTYASFIDWDLAQISNDPPTLSGSSGGWINTRANLYRL